MRNVKNSPENYIKRSQIKPASTLGKRFPEIPQPRTAADFKKAVIDDNFYVSFKPDLKRQDQK